MSPFIFLRYLILPASLFFGWLAGSYWNFSVLVLCFCLHPILCLLIKQTNEADDIPFQKGSKLQYRISALLFVPVLLFSTLFFLWKSPGFSIVEFAGIAVSLGLINGVLGFTLAHEFVHRRTVPEQTAAWLLMLQNNYLHYGIEHVKGHHVYACTSNDPHAATYNESFYHFLPRSVLYTAINAWKIEAERLKKKNQHVISLANKLIQQLLIQLTLYILLFIAGGWMMFLFYCAQSFIAITLLHMADYLQHYGLLRKETKEHKYERISAVHAWGNTHAKAGFNLFQLDKHADHHLHPSHSYETLVHHDESPELPATYSIMILLALVPSLWFRQMNKRIPAVLLQ